MIAGNHSSVSIQNSHPVKSDRPDTGPKTHELGYLEYRGRLPFAVQETLAGPLPMWMFCPYLNFQRFSIAPHLVAMMKPFLFRLKVHTSLFLIINNLQ